MGISVDIYNNKHRTKSNNRKTNIYVYVNGISYQIQNKHKCMEGQQIPTLNTLV